MPLLPFRAAICFLALTTRNRDSGEGNGVTGWVSHWALVPFLVTLIGLWSTIL